MQQLLLGDTVGRDEIDAVGVDLDHPRAARAQPVDHGTEQLAPLGRDRRRGVEVAAVRLRKTEVTVKAVDENFEGRLQGRGRVVFAQAIGFALGSPHARLCLRVGESCAGRRGGPRKIPS